MDINSVQLHVEEAGDVDDARVVSDVSSEYLGDEDSNASDFQERRSCTNLSERSNRASTSSQPVDALLGSMFSSMSEPLG